MATNNNKSKFPEVTVNKAAAPGDDVPPDMAVQEEPEKLKYEIPGKAKYMGRNVKDEDKAVVFRSLAKNPMIILDDKYEVVFQNHFYATDNPFEIDTIRNMIGVFGIEIFENEFPEWAKQQLKEVEKDYQKHPHEPELHN